MTFFKCQGCQKYTKPKIEGLQCWWLCSVKKTIITKEKRKLNAALYLEPLPSVKSAQRNPKVSDLKIINIPIVHYFMKAITVCSVKEE